MSKSTKPWVEFAKKLRPILWRRQGRIILASISQKADAVAQGFVLKSKQRAAAVAAGAKKAGEQTDDAICVYKKRRSKADFAPAWNIATILVLRLPGLHPKQNRNPRGGFD